MLPTLKKPILALGLASVLLVAGCSSNNNDTTNENTSDDGATNYSEAVNYKITGIEPGAGISVATEKALEAYENLAGWDVELSSTPGMLVELDEAIKKEEPIIVTGWNPHFMFAKYPDLKYLEDPQNLFGGEEGINTLTRLDFEDDHPEAFKFLSQFEWEVEDMEAIMYEAEETGDEVEEVAKRWVEENADKVSTWLEGVEKDTGDKIELVSTPWDSERASSGVVQEVMNQHGFDVKVTPVDVAIVFESLAQGDTDATVAAWLPATHQDFFEKHEDDIVDLGPNLTGAKIGLTVPAYMDIDSIEELEAK